ncbi:MAG: hypothetical protein AAFS11_00465 [Planctomycetota bacterium]
MNGTCSKMLFGGALLCAGLHSAMADAQVSDASFRFIGSVTNQYEYDGYVNGYFVYADTGINESFDVTTGVGGLPFSRQAEGGYSPYAYYAPLYTFASASGDGSLSANGELSFSGSIAVRNGLNFPDDPPNDTPNSAGVTVTFAVDTPSDVSIDVTGFFFDNDFGGTSVSLRDVDNNVVYQYFGFGSTDSFAGMLAPGEYRLLFGASSQGTATVALNVVPSPSTLGVAVMAGLLGVRRRR